MLSFYNFNILNFIFSIKIYLFLKKNLYKILAFLYFNSTTIYTIMGLKFMMVIHPN